MEGKDIIKKLKDLSLPEIEIPSHKERLKSVLFEKYFQEKKKKAIFGILFKALPVGIVGGLIILIFSNLVLPKYNLAAAKEIALRNSQIKEWIEKGAVIEDIEIVNNRAYVLIQPKEKSREITSASQDKEIKKEEFYGALAEVNLKEKEIAKIERLTPPPIPLIKKEEIEEIVKNNPDIQKSIPREAEIQSIKIPSPQLKLIKKRNSVEVLPEPETEKSASVIYQFGKDRWEGKINLDEEKVEEMNFLGEIKDNGGLEK